MTGRPGRWITGRWGFAAALGLLYLAGAVFYLYRVGPAEDAYILLRYADMVAAGHGITYSPGGDPVGGATELLWMFLLAGVRSLGFDPVIGAAVLNALLTVWIGALLHDFARWPGDDGPATGRAAPAALLPAAVVALPHLVHPAYAGFGMLLPAALTLLCVHVLLLGPQRRYAWLPLLGVVLGIARPECVVLGVGFTVVGFVQARRQGAPLPWRATLVAIVLGVLYLVWRRWYFGEILPLPVHVKSSSPALLEKGILRTRLFLGERRGVLLCAGILLLAARRGPAPRLLRALLPALILVGVLCLSTQTQNRGHRFQSPLTFSMVAVVVVLVARYARRIGPARGLALGVAATALLHWGGGPSVGFKCFNTRKWDYMVRISPRYPEILPEGTRLALTEAGLVAYRHRGPVLDLVGLNTPEPAHGPVTAGLLERFDPDVMLIHTSRALRRPVGDGAPMEVTVQELLARLRPGRRRTLALAVTGAEDYAEVGWRPSRFAIYVALAFLRDHPERFRLWLVPHLGGYMHLWAVRRGAPYSGDLEEALYRTVADRHPYAYLPR